MKQKIVIACGDGAIRGGYIAGAYYALKQHFPELWANVTDFTASSASIGGIFYEICMNDPALGKKLWTKDFSDPNLIRLKNIFRFEKIYDIDYLVDTIFKKNNPCDTTSFRKTHFGYYFPLINTFTKETVIFNNRGLEGGSNFSVKNIEVESLYEYIRAATAAPILFDRSVSIKGDEYIDAAIRVPYFLDNEVFTEHKKIVILSQRPISWKIVMYYKLLGLLFLPFGKLDKSFYREISNKYKRYKEFKDFLNENGDDDTFFIYPTEDLNSVWDNSEKSLEYNFRMGEEDVLNNKEQIMKFYNQNTA